MASRDIRKEECPTTDTSLLRGHFQTTFAFLRYYDVNILTPTPPSLLLNVTDIHYVGVAWGQLLLAFIAALFCCLVPLVNILVFGLSQTK